MSATGPGSDSLDSYIPDERNNSDFWDLGRSRLIVQTPRNRNLYWVSLDSIPEGTQKPMACPVICSQTTAWDFSVLRSGCEVVEVADGDFAGILDVSIVQDCLSPFQIDNSMNALAIPFDPCLSFD